MTPQDKRFAAATKLVENNVMGSMAIGLIPVPAVDVAGLFAQQLYMLKRVGEIYGQEVSTDSGRRTIAALLGGFVPTALVLPTASLLRVVPVVGHAVSLFTMPILAGAATYALGKVYIDNFESGGTALTLNPAKLRANFRRYYKEGRGFAASNGSRAKPTADQPQPATGTPKAPSAPLSALPVYEGAGRIVAGAQDQNALPSPEPASVEDGKSGEPLAMTAANKTEGAGNSTLTSEVESKPGVAVIADNHVDSSIQTQITNAETDPITQVNEQATAANVQSYDEAVLADEPFAFWKLDETSGTTVEDATENGNVGDIYGGVKLGQPSAIAGSTSMEFDGSTGYLEFGGFWGGGEEITVEAWVKVSAASDDFQAVVSALGEEFVQLQLHKGGSINAYTDTGIASLPIVPQTPTDVWRHVALVVASGKSKVYVDGKEAGSSDAAFSSINATSIMRIGSGLDGGRFFRGQIDRVAIYETALSSEQIQAHMNAAGKGESVAATDSTGSVALAYLKEHAGLQTAEEVAAGIGKPLDQVQAALNQLLGKGDVVTEDGRYGTPEEIEAPGRPDPGTESQAGETLPTPEPPFEWKSVCRENPPWSDDAGWKHAQYYSTIRLGDVDGDGQAELIGRSAVGIQTWHFDDGERQWKPLGEATGVCSDGHGWANPQYYSTIQLADVDGDGRDELIARGSGGISTYRFNEADKQWKEVCNANPPWRDGGGWNQAQYYSTIRLADIDGDGRAELVARGAAGISTWRFDPATDKWQEVCSNQPALSDTQGWAQAQYYSTIQLADIDGDGQAELIARGAAGISTWRFDKTSNQWQQVCSNQPALSDTQGWAQAQYYPTIQLADIDGDGQAELIARGAAGIWTWRFDKTSNQWQQVSSGNPELGDQQGWAQAQYYSAIQLADIDGDGQAELIARGAAGIWTWRFDKTSNQWQQVSSGNPEWSDNHGWDQSRYYSTIQAADIDGDGRAELIARAAAGIVTFSGPASRRRAADRQSRNQVDSSKPAKSTNSEPDPMTLVDQQTAASSPQSYDEAVLADKPFAYWKLDETSGKIITDATGNENEGNVHGGVTLGQPGAIAGSTAPEFDGSTGYLEFGGFWGGGEEITVEAWVKVNAASDDFQAVVSALGEEFVQLQLHKEGNINAYTDTGTVALPIVAQTPTGVWRHVVLVVASGKSRIYVDGKQVGDSDAAFSSITATPIVRIGSGLDSKRFFGGQIDRVAIYEAALSIEQIQGHLKAAGKSDSTTSQSGGEYMLYHGQHSYGSYAKDSALTIVIPTKKPTNGPDAIVCLTWDKNAAGVRNATGQSEASVNREGDTLTIRTSYYWFKGQVKDKVYEGQYYNPKNERCGTFKVASLGVWG